MELRKNNLPFDSTRPLPLAKTARQGMEKVLDDAERSRMVRENALQAAQERIDRARQAHATQLQALRETGEARRSELQDRIEISDTARMFLQGAEEGDAAERERERWIESLRAAYRSGSLNTTERVQRAAERLLDGDAS